VPLTFPLEYCREYEMICLQRFHLRSSLLLFVFSMVLHLNCYDHFKVYQVEKIEVNRKIMLEDPFEKIQLPALLTAIEFFATPVSKNNKKIKQPEAHLTWYRMQVDGPHPTRRVTFTNQFGTQSWKIGAPVYLLVPTEKIEFGSALPEKLNCFQCYRVLSDDSLTIKVIFMDQFDQKAGKKQIAVVRKPLYLGVPVKQNNTAIVHPDFYLACYLVTPIEMNPPLKQVTIRNQFGQCLLQVQNSLILGVPSKIKQVEEVK